MKVFALIGYLDYEASDLIGIYASREAAEAAIEALPEWKEFDQIEILEHSIQG